MSVIVEKKNGTILHTNVANVTHNKKQPSQLRGRFG